MILKSRWTDDVVNRTRVERAYERCSKVKPVERRIAKSPQSAQNQSFQRTATDLWRKIWAVHAEMHFSTSVEDEVVCNIKVSRYVERKYYNTVHFPSPARGVFCHWSCTYSNSNAVSQSSSSDADWKQLKLEDIIPFITLKKHNIKYTHKNMEIQAQNSGKKPKIHTKSTSVVETRLTSLHCFYNSCLPDKYPSHWNR